MTTAILWDSGARPLMYSRSADLDAMGSNYFDRTPVGSIEAFTRRRYHVSGSEGSSPKVRRAMHAQTNEEAYVELGIGKGIDSRRLQRKLHYFLSDYATQVLANRMGYC